MNYLKVNTFIICFVYISLVGFLFIIWNNIDRYAFFLKQKVELAVFVKSGEKSCEVVEEKIRALDNVRSVKFIPKEYVKQKLSQFKREVSIIGTNPFPDTFSVIPKEFSTSKIEVLAAQVKSISGVSDVKYDRNIVSVIDGLKLFSRFSKSVFRLLVVILFIGIAIASICIYRNGANLLIYKYLDLIAGFTGLVAGIICLKLLSMVLAPVTTYFLSISQILVLFLTGLCMDLISSMTEVTVNEP